MRGYDTAAYAASRLVDTIILYDGAPVIVRTVKSSDVGTGIAVTFTEILDPTEKVKTDDISKFNLDPVRLGYVNYRKDPVYLTRAPMRRDWRQGLRALNIYDADGNNPRMIPYHVIAQTIMNRYPTFASILETMSSPLFEYGGLAYHRDFCLSREGRLRYKGMFAVGQVNMDNGDVVIDADYSWVGEAFNESMEAA